MNNVYHNEIAEFGASGPGDYGEYDLVIRFRDETDYSNYGSLTEERQAVVRHTVVSMLGVLGAQDETEAFAAALDKMLALNTFAPEGMAFPVGTSRLPVPIAEAGQWHDRRPDERAPRIHGVTPETNP